MTVLAICLCDVTLNLLKSSTVMQGSKGEALYVRDGEEVEEEEDDDDDDDFDIPYDMGAISPRSPLGPTIQTIQTPPLGYGDMTGQAYPANLSPKSRRNLWDMRFSIGGRSCNSIEDIPIPPYDMRQVDLGRQSEPQETTVMRRLSHSLYQKTAFSSFIDPSTLSSNGTADQSYEEEALEALEALVGEEEEEEEDEEEEEEPFFSKDDPGPSFCRQFCRPMGQ